MSKREIEIGPAGRPIAAALAARRRMLNMTQSEVSEGVQAFGRTLTAASIGEIERLARRIDVDDFVALCRTLHLDTARIIEDAENEMIQERQRRQDDADAERLQGHERMRDAQSLAGSNPRGRLPLDVPFGWGSNGNDQ